MRMPLRHFPLTEGRRRFQVGLLGCLSCGCGMWLDYQVNTAFNSNPAMKPSIEATGLIDAVPWGEDIGACGPDAQTVAMIPDCPMPDVCFTPACVGHDICYTTCGTSQDLCDSMFFVDMCYLCRLNTVDPRCYSLAWIYYQAVARYGGPYFSASQNYACKASRPSEAQRPADSALVLAPSGSPFYDGDDDLLPDDWELQVGLNPLDAGDARDDPDQDGKSNLVEYILQTDPLVPD